MSNQYEDDPNPELLAPFSDKVAAPIANEPAVIIFSSSPDANAPLAPRPLTPSSTAKRGSTVPRAPQPHRAAAPDPAQNHGSVSSRQAGAPSSTSSRQTARVPVPRNSILSGGASVSSSTYLDASKHSARSGTSAINLNSQTKPQNAPLKHFSSLAAAHSSHSTPSSRPQDPAAEPPMGQAPPSRPTHVLESNEGAVAVPHGLDASIRSITSSRSRGRPPVQAASSRPQRALVPKRPLQALLDDEESTSSSYSPSGGGRDGPNDDDYISDAVGAWQPKGQPKFLRDGRKKTAKRARLGQSSLYEDAQGDSIQVPQNPVHLDYQTSSSTPKPEREFVFETPKPSLLAARTSVAATFSPAPHLDPSSSTTTIPPNLNRKKYTFWGSDFTPQPAAEASVSTSARPQPAPRITTNIGIQPTDRHQAEIPILDPNSRIGHKMRHKLRTMNDGDVERQNEARLALAAWADEVSNTRNTHTRNAVTRAPSTLGSNPLAKQQQQRWDERMDAY